MSDVLKEKIKEYLRLNNISVRELERRACLPSSTLSAILIDKSKNPKLETLIKIANSLECSLDEIFGREKYLKKSINDKLRKLPSNQQLFKSVCIYVTNFMDMKPRDNFDVSDTINCIEEIYKYSIEANSLTVDKKFADWFLDKTFNI